MAKAYHKNKADKRIAARKADLEKNLHLSDSRLHGGYKVPGSNKK